MKILVVDDSTTMRSIVKRTLSGAMEADFVDASDGKEALELLKGAASDANLIMLDINMPVMNGLQALDAIRAQDEFKQVPIVMVTTEADKATVVKAISAGANNYVVKPFEAEVLIEKVTKVLP